MCAFASCALPLLSWFDSWICWRPADIRNRLCDWLLLPLLKLLFCWTLESAVLFCLDMLFRSISCGYCYWCWISGYFQGLPLSCLLETGVLWPLELLLSDLLAFRLAARTVKLFLNWPGMFPLDINYWTLSFKVVRGLSLISYLTLMNLMSTTSSPSIKSLNDAIFLSVKLLFYSYLFSTNL